MEYSRKLIDAGAWLQKVNPSWMYMSLARKIIREAPAAEIFGQWINAQEQLPGKSDEYIVMIAGAEQPSVLWYDTEEKTFFEETVEETIYYRVTHWMALPDPPVTSDGADH